MKFDLSVWYCFTAVTVEIFTSRSEKDPISSWIIELEIMPF